MHRRIFEKVGKETFKTVDSPQSCLFLGQFAGWKFSIKSIQEKQNKI